MQIISKTTVIRMRLLSLTLLFLLLVVSVKCWWPWGGDEEEEAADMKDNEEEEKEKEGFKEQLERDLAGIEQEAVKIEHPARKKEQNDEEKSGKEENKVKVTMSESGESSSLSEEDAANVAALLETPELARKMDRKAFEEKLDEVFLRFLNSNN